MNTGPWGGSEELWTQAATRLKKEGHVVTASVPWWPQLSPKMTALAELGIPLEVRKGIVRPSLPVRLLKRVKKLYQEERKEVEWLAEQKPDLAVISQGGTGDGLEWMNFCRHAKIPYVSVVQCNQEAWWPPDSVGETIAQDYCAARKVFCVSNHNLELLRRQIVEPLPQGEVIRNPFNVPAEEPPAWPKENGTWNLACVARLEPSAKGQDVLLQILASLKWQERPIKVNLFGSGNWEKGLKKLAGALKTKNVSFRGHVQDVRNIWAENHLLVLPSRYEGLPLALVEAMWCARPAVVTDAGGSAEMCLDGKTGFVAAAAVVEVLDDILEKAWNARSQWRDMGQVAYARAKEIIPKDPVGYFCTQLKQAAATKNS